MADIKSHSTLATNLISYWDMQEASGTRYDLHGANNLTDNNTVLSTTGKIGLAADFERGNNEYFTAPDSASFPHSASGDDISAFMWVNFESVVSWETFIQHYLAAGNLRSWSFYHDTSALYLELSTNGSSATSTATVSWTPSTGVWYHIGFTYDVSAGEVKFYVNGAQQGATQTGKDTSYFASTAKLQIGTFFDGSSTNGSFDGLMDEVGLWKKVLTSTEVSDLYNGGSALPYYAPNDISNDATLSTSLVSYWELEEASGTRVDSHGSNDLTDNNTVGTATGIIGNGADFEASNSESLSITNAAQSGLGVTGNFSISLWLKFESAPSFDTNRWIITKSLKTSPTGGYWLTYRQYPLNNDNFEFRFYNSTNSTSAYTNDLGLSTGVWYHIVLTATVASSTFKFYLNGVEIQVNYAVQSATSVSTNSEGFRMGASTTPDEFFDGIIDETAFWSKALTVAEVRALYGYGTPPEYNAGVVATFTPRVSFFM
jgi:hypothetical protein